MRFTEKIKYNIKKALPVLAIAGAGLMTSCDKDDEPLHDVELEFFETPFDNNYDAVSIENIQKLSRDNSVQNIYMKVLDKNDYSGCFESNFKQLRKYMTERVNISPKVHGRGNFNFPVGNCAKEDSLWFVQQGWTINKHLQNQK